jgi:hypothetical protein
METTTSTLYIGHERADQREPRRPHPRRDDLATHYLTRVSLARRGAIDAPTLSWERTDDQDREALLEGQCAVTDMLIEAMTRAGVDIPSVFTELSKMANAAINQNTQDVNGYGDFGVLRRLEAEHDRILRDTVPDDWGTPQK